jgi:hypothetical protein
MERTPLQYAAGTLAGSAFIATTQILTGGVLDLPLYVALVAFGISIPFQIIIFFMPTPLSIKETQRLRAASQPLSWPLRLYFSIHLFSSPFIIIGFFALFCHFARSLGFLSHSQLGPRTRYFFAPRSKISNNGLTNTNSTAHGAL